MFQPVGNQSTSVYWRRRFVLIASIVVVLVLGVLTVRAMSSGASGPTQHLGAGGDPRPSSPPARPGTTPSSSSASHAAAPRGHHRHSTESRHSAEVSDSPSSGQSGASSGTPSSTTPPPRCAAKDLDVQAVVAHPTYKVGDHPEVELQVTNVGTEPCVQDLADKQVVLKIYNGESRVWGSHDCQIEPGTADRTLEVDSPVRVSIIWSGLTSQPGCAGTRQRVGAGTYTLYASLSGHSGKAAQFSMT